MNNTDLTLSKRVYLDKNETRHYIELRAEAYNLFNHTQFQLQTATNGGSGVQGNINSSNFGRVLSALPGPDHSASG